MKKLLKGKLKILLIIVIIIMLIIAGVIGYIYSSHITYDKEVEHTLSNPNADETTKAVYKYICDNFEEVMLSAQQESTWMDSPEYEMEYLYEHTGKYPAIRGLDYMNNDYDGVNERAIAWWEAGGLVTICWHTGLESSGYEESKADNVDFDKLFTEGTQEYNTLMETWDIAATHLQELQEAGVTVIWRPYHEFDGGWFWWGKSGSKNFIKLWQMMYDKFTYEYGLNNLIWVYGYSHLIKPGWYVGDEYCDIIGSDSYHNNTNNFNWKRLNLVGASNKPYAFHECGRVPKVEDFQKKGCMWSWFMIWHTDWLLDNDIQRLSEIYNSQAVITRDELPEF